MSPSSPLHFPFISILLSSSSPLLIFFSLSHTIEELLLGVKTIHNVIPRHIRSCSEGRNEKVKERGEGRGRSRERGEAGEEREGDRIGIKEEKVTYLYICGLVGTS